MATFTYTARAAKGELKSATIEATSREEAITQLRKQRLNVIKIDEQQKRKKAGKVTMRDVVISAPASTDEATIGWLHREFALMDPNGLAWNGVRR